jgi:hypothetical protein
MVPNWDVGVNFAHTLRFCCTFVHFCPLKWYACLLCMCGWGCQVSYPWVKVEPGVLKDPPVPYGTVAPRIHAAVEQLALEMPDEAIEAQKPGNRGLMLSELQGILRRCADGDPEDPRWDELRLRTLDRMARLLRLYQPDQPRERQGAGDPRLLAAQAARILEELETRNLESPGRGLKESEASGRLGQESG